MDATPRDTMTTDCAICYSEICKESGITTLSCSHSFHLGCIATWIMKSETCPCCRSEVSEFEKMPASRARTMSYESDTMQEELYVLTNLPWIQMPSGNWIIDQPTPILQMPPRIQRIPLTSSLLNPDAAEFYPSSASS